MRTALLLLALGGIACSSGGSGGGGANGDRTGVCLAWQDAVCDHVADKCGESPRTECDELVQTFFCRSDAVMQACTDALPGATCGTLPAACDNVADPQPAVDWCVQFVNTVCERAVSCEFATLTECLNTLQPTINCSSAIGLGPSADQCNAEIQTASCAQLDSGLPASCDDVVKSAS